MDRQKASLVAQISAVMKAEKWALAEARLTDALKIYPSDYGFLEFLGVAQINQNRPAEALRTFKKAIKRAPKHGTAFRNLAYAQLKTGALKDAQSNAQKALALAPKVADHWMLIGDIYLQRKQSEKAIESYKKAAVIGPDLIIVAAKLLSELERLTRFEELETHVSAYEKRTPDHPVIRLYRGVLHYHAKAYSEAKAALEGFGFAIEKKAPYRKFELLRTRYLGRVNDALHQEEDAFKCFTRSKALNRRFHENPAPPTVFQEMCAMREAYFGPEVSAGWGSESSFEDEPVFLIGFPRSGTTLLNAFLGGHSGISVLEEMPIVDTMRVALGTDSQNDISALSSLNEGAIANARKTYLDARKAYKKTGLIIDKMPINMVFAGEILRIFPRAKFIFAMRDPADAVLSCFMQTFKLNPPMAALDTPAEAAKTYDLALKTWQNIISVYAPNVVVSRYEDLISDPEAALRPILSFLGIEWEAALLDHQASVQKRERITTPSRTQVIKPLYNTAIARWERYAQLMPEAGEILAPWRKEFGYSD